MDESSIDFSEEFSAIKVLMSSSTNQWKVVVLFHWLLELEEGNFNLSQTVKFLSTKLQSLVRKGQYEKKIRNDS